MLTDSYIDRRSFSTAHRRLYRYRGLRANLRQVAGLLAEIGYQGWVVVEAEQDPAKANPLEMARIGHRALSEAFGQAGFAIAG
jgi:hypothetical protein